MMDSLPAAANESFKEHLARKREAARLNQQKLRKKKADEETPEMKRVAIALRTAKRQAQRARKARQSDQARETAAKASKLTEALIKEFDARSFGTCSLCHQVDEVSTATHRCSTGCLVEKHVRASLCEKCWIGCAGRCPWCYSVWSQYDADEQVEKILMDTIARADSRRLRPRNADAPDALANMSILDFGLS